MIDIHSHILPFIDDGAIDINEAVNMLKLEKEQGVTTVIATPHLGKYNLTSNKNDIQRSFSLLKAELKKINLDIDIRLGREIHCAENLFELIKTDELCTLASSKYILIELNENNKLDNLDNLLYEIKLLGYIPVLAHLERNEKLFDKKELLQNVIKEGACIQINASSVITLRTNHENKFCKYLLDNHLVSFIASDCHNTDNRRPNLGESYSFINSNYGEKYANELHLHNPQKLLANIPINYPKYIIKKKNILCKILKIKNGA